MQVIVNDLVVHYQKTGRGRTMLLLHGWGSSGAAFRALIQHWQSDFLCVAPDLPGFGDSQPPAKPWDLEAYAKWLKQLMTKIDVRPDVVVAHSNGAALAIKAIDMGVLHPEKLVIYGGAGVRGLRRGRKQFLKMVAKSGKPLLFLLPPTTRQKVRRRWYGAIGSEMLDIAGMEETFKLTVAEDMLPAASRLSLPTLLIYGENDSATPPLIGQLYHQAIAGSTLEIIAGAGHYVFRDAAEEVMRLTEEFLR